MSAMQRKTEKHVKLDGNGNQSHRERIMAHAFLDLAESTGLVLKIALKFSTGRRGRSHGYGDQIRIALAAAERLGFLCGGLLN